MKLLARVDFLSKAPGYQTYVPPLGCEDGGFTNLPYSEGTQEFQPLSTLGELRLEFCDPLLLSQEPLYLTARILESIA